MTHALALLPHVSSPPGAEPLPFHADPIFAAIDAHSEAWSVFQVAPQGEASIRAEDAHDAALYTLLGTACATRQGAFCLLRHLRWFLTEEAVNAEGYGVSWPVAQARESDLTLLLGCDGIDRLVRIPTAMPSGRLPAPPLALPAPETFADARTTAAHSGRFLLIGEAIGALVLIASGCLFSGIASLI